MINFDIGLGGAGGVSSTPAPHPHIGETVAFYPGPNEGIHKEGAYLSGMVVHVHTPEKVNLHVWDMHGQSRPLSNVPFFQQSHTQEQSFSYACPLPY